MADPDERVVPPTLDAILQVEHLRRRLDDQSAQMRELTEVLRLVTDGQRRLEVSVTSLQAQNTPVEASFGPVRTGVVPPPPPGMSTHDPASPGLSGLSGASAAAGASPPGFVAVNPPGLAGVGAGTPGTSSGGHGDPLSKSDKWLQPLEAAKQWGSRADELTGFAQYMMYLSSWLAAMSDKYPEELFHACRHPSTILQEALPQDLAVRSVRLQAVLVQAFAKNVKATRLITCYVEECITPCGYETIRRLAREFTLRSMQEGLYFRQQLAQKAFKEENVTDLLFQMDTEFARFDRMTTMLADPSEAVALSLTVVDKLAILLRSLHGPVREYALLHSNGMYEDVRAKAIEWESRHRIWADPFGKQKNLHKYTGDTPKKVEGTCHVCGKPGHFAKDCKFKDRNPICHSCGERGHFAAACPKKRSPSQQSCTDYAGKGIGESKGKGKEKGKGKGKGAGGKQSAEPKGKGKKGKGKGKKGAREFTESEYAEEPVEEPDSEHAGHVAELMMGYVATSEQSFVPVDSKPSEVKAMFRMAQSVASAEMEVETGDVSMEPETMNLPLNPNDSPEWVLLDSGASSHVLSSQFVAAHESWIVYTTSQMAMFSTADGSKVKLSKVIGIELPFIVDQAKGSSGVQWILVEAFVGKVEHNILSLGTLCERGWSFSMTPKHAFLRQSGCSLSIEWYATCPWVRMDLSATRTRRSSYAHRVSIDPHAQVKQFEVSSSSSYRVRSPNAEAKRSELKSCLKGSSSLKQYVLLKEFVQRPSCMSHEVMRSEVMHSELKPVTEDMSFLKAVRTSQELSKATVSKAESNSTSSLDRACSSVEGSLKDVPTRVLRNEPKPEPCHNPATEAVANSGMSAVEAREVVPKSLQPFKFDATKHALRGHQPADTRNCEICRRAKGVSQSRRRGAGESHVLQADFGYLEMAGYPEKTKHPEKQKFLVIYRPETQCMFAIVAFSSVDKTRACIRRASEFLGLLGEGDPIELDSDAESAVSHLVKGVDMNGRHLVPLKGAPERHGFVGGAERSIRQVKESCQIVLIELQEHGMQMSFGEDAIQCLFNFVSMTYNLFAKNASHHTPREELVQRELPEIACASFGMTVLAETPSSFAPSSSRFSPAAYWHPSVGSLGHVCTSRLADGQLKKFVAKTIKLVMPPKYDPELCTGVLKPGQPFPKSSSSDSRSGEVKDGSSKPEASPKAPERVAPPEVTTYKGGNPPAAWYKEHGKTPGCIACDKGVKGRVHSVACKARYKKWLTEQLPSSDRRVLPRVEGRPEGVRSEPSEVIPSRPPVERDEIGRIKNAPDLPKDPLESETPALFVPQSGADETMAPVEPNAPSHKRRLSDPTAEGPTDAIEVDRSGAPSVDESMDVPGESMQESEYTPSRPPSVLDDSNPMDLDEDVAMEGNRLDQLVRWTIQSCFVGRSYEECHLSQFRNSIFYGEQKVPVTLNRAKFYQKRPSYVLEEGSSKELDPKMTLQGMLVEFGQMDSNRLGRVLPEESAKKLAVERGQEIIPRRWVNTYKASKDVVRCRCVVQQVSAGAGTAVSLGISSPTASVDGLKMVLALAGYFGSFLGALDVSCAFMASPLPMGFHQIVRLPAGTVDSNGRPVYVDLIKAMNGLRVSPRAWMMYISDIIQTQCGLSANPIEPSLFAGWTSVEGLDSEFVNILVYVDDLLIRTETEAMYEKLVALLKHEIQINETGRLGIKQKGELNFLGRRIWREAQSDAVHVGMKEGFFEDMFGLPMVSGLKPCDAVPQIRSQLDSVDPANNKELSPEQATAYRSVLGRMAWLAPFRADLCFAMSQLAVGQSTPMIKHEKALKAVSRYVKGTAHLCQTFPIPDVGSLYHQEGMREFSLVSYCDASFAPMSNNGRKSVSGGLTIWLNSCIKSYTRTQSVVAQSSAEAELIGVVEMTNESLGLQKIASFACSGEFPEEYPRDGTVDPLFVCTDSSATQFIAHRMDVQRRLRHAEIRWEFLQRVIGRGLPRLLWVKGSENPSDMLTKVLDSATQLRYRKDLGIVANHRPFDLSSTDQKNSKKKKSETGSSNSLTANPPEDHRVIETEGFVVEEGSAMEIKQSEMVLANVAETDFKVPKGTRYLLVELCCEEESVLSTAWMLKESHYAWRVTESVDLKRESTILALMEALGSLGSEVKVWIHASLPCTGGSPFMYLHEYERSKEHSEKRQLFKDLLKNAKRLLGLGYDWSFELSEKCAYWGWKVVHQLRMCSPVRKCYTALPRLCSSVETAGFSKRWRFISSRPEVAKALHEKHSMCVCKWHEQPDYRASCIYNQELVKTLVHVFHKCLVCEVKGDDTFLW